MKVERDLRYSIRSVFETFPWPQNPSPNAVLRVAEAAREVRDARVDALASISGGLRELYKTLELPGKSSLRDAHAELDAAVAEAYRFDNNSVTSLLELNLDVAARLERGEEVTPPGLPPGLSGDVPARSVDCLEP